MLYSDLSQLKVVLGIDPADTSEDVSLLFYLEWASRWIEELLDRPGLSYETRTEYYDGTGTQKLRLRSRPVFASGLSVWLDEGGYYGEATNSFSGNPLTYGTDYGLRLDAADGSSSRSGILFRINNVWPVPSVRQQGYLAPFLGSSFGQVKVTYTAGYTVDTLPAGIRMAVDLLVARIRNTFPLGLELGSESYEERSISMITSEKEKLLTLVKPLLMPYRNWSF